MARAEAVTGLAYIHVARCGEHTTCALRSDATLVRLRSALGFSFAFGRVDRVRDANSESPVIVDGVGVGIGRQNLSVRIQQV
jgi:hypothetical protein